MRYEALIVSLVKDLHCIVIPRELTVRFAMIAPLGVVDKVCLVMRRRNGRHQLEAGFAELHSLDEIPTELVPKSRERLKLQTRAPGGKKSRCFHLPLCLHRNLLNQEAEHPRGACCCS